MKTTPLVGTVVRFLPREGYGFIRPRGVAMGNRDHDVLFHWKAFRGVRGSGGIREGEEVTYVLATDGRTRATEVRRAHCKGYAPSNLNLDGAETAVAGARV